MTSGLPSQAKPLPIFILTSVWHAILATYLIRLSLNIFSADTLYIAGKAADLGRPVQVFAGAFLFVVALAFLLAIPARFLTACWRALTHFGSKF